MVAFLTQIDEDNLIDEQWKQIEEYDGDYEVSNFGRIKSHKRTQVIILSQSYTNSGYLKVSLYKDGTRKTYLVHRLVGKLFVYNNDPISQNTIDHIDEDKTNNKASNLQWMSKHENILEYHKRRREKGNL